jgi:hypothetical protein
MQRLAPIVLFLSGLIVVTLQKIFGQFESDLLYYFNQFGCHRSQGQWLWPKLVACPVSQKIWPAFKKHLKNFALQGTYNSCSCNNKWLNFLACPRSHFDWPAPNPQPN